MASILEVFDPKTTINHRTLSVPQRSQRNILIIKEKANHRVRREIKLCVLNF
jgi:hypothetical protein